MDPGTFSDDILKPLEVTVTGFDAQRVWIAYQDATNIEEIITRFEVTIGGREVDELNRQGKYAEATEVFFQESYISTLHKALVEFANLFMVVLLHELYQRPSREPTVLVLAESAAPTQLQLNQAMLHRAYCLYVYRNKVVVHHDIPRTFTTRKNRVDGRRWLNPMPHGLGESGGIGADDGRDLMALQRRYASNPAVRRETNLIELVTPLFYAIPGPYGDKASVDRALINRIAERMGCRSMTVPEIVSAIDGFAREMTRVAPALTISST